MNVLSLIPARGGSKGIPHKNIIPLLGKPLLAYTVEVSVQTPSITRTVVSTDDTAIAAVARQYGSEVVQRPAEISGDKSSSESALLHALDHLRDKEQYEPDLVVFLQATSPMRQPDDIQNAIDTLRREEADSLFSATPSHGFLWRKVANDVQPLSYDYQNRPMRQDAPVDFVENGSIYVFKPRILRTYNNRLGGKIAVYSMPLVDSFQIDGPEDISLVEHLMSLRPKPRLDFSVIRALVLDFDGVMTDNRVLVDQDGREAVLAHRGDGWGISQLKEHGIKVVVLSKEKNPVVAARCRKLNIDCCQAEDHKLAVLQSLAQDWGLQPQQIAYVGNDVNDLDCMQWVGIPIAVADAVPEICALSSLITVHSGGYGAIREIADLIIRAKSHVDSK